MSSRYKRKFRKSYFKISNYLSSLTKNIVSNMTQASVVSQEKPVLFETHLIPIDWSVKTRVRFFSKFQFKCCNSLKSLHESNALYNFCKFNTYYDRLNQSDVSDFVIMFFWIFFKVRDLIVFFCCLKKGQQ